MARPNLRPRPKPSEAPFPFLTLPAELRLQIYNYLLLSEPSCSHTHVDMFRPRLRQPAPVPLRRHGMLLANRQLHAEYAQACYERTNFFFYVGATTNNGERLTILPLRTLPPALLPNLRQCKLYVDLGILPLRLCLSIKAFAARIEALLGRMERVRWVHLVWNLTRMIEQLASWRSLLEEREEEKEEKRKQEKWLVSWRGEGGVGGEGGDARIRGRVKVL
jgi:hypothetical protein